MLNKCFGKFLPPSKSIRIRQRNEAAMAHVNTTRIFGKGQRAGAMSKTANHKANRTHYSAVQVKSRLTPQMTLKPNAQNRTPLTYLSGQSALRVRLAASNKRDGNDWARIVNAAPTVAAVCAERTSEVAGGAAQNSRAVL